MRTLFSIVIVTLTMHASYAVAEEPAAAPRLDNYGDSLPPGAVLRLGTKRLQTKGGFAWTADGEALITLSGGELQFWDVENGHLRKTLLAPITTDTFSTYATQFAMSRDGKRLVFTDFHGAVGAWNLETDELISRPALGDRGQGENLALAMTADGTEFVTLRHNGELQVWDAAQVEIVRTWKLPEEHWTNRPPMAVSPDGKTLAVGSMRSRRIYLLDLVKGGEPIAIKGAHDERLCSLFFLPDGRLVSTGAAHGEPPARRFNVRSQMRIWDVKKPGARTEWPFPDSLPGGCSIAFSPDGNSMVSVHSDRIAIWNTASQGVVRTIEGVRFWNAMVASVAIDPLGKYVAIDDKHNYVRIWDLATGKPHLSTEDHHQGSIASADWSPNGKTIATGCGRGDVCLWDAATGRLLRRFQGPEFGVYSLAFPDDGRVLMVAGHEPNLGGEPDVLGLVRWHDAASGELLREQILPGRAGRTAISPDRSLVAVAMTADLDRPDTESVRFLDMATGKERGAASIGSPIIALAWSPNSKTLHVAARSGLLQCDAANDTVVAGGALPHQRMDHGTGMLVPGLLVRAAFLKDAAEIITAGTLPEVYGWSVPKGEKLWTIPIDANMVRGLALSPDESILACVASDMGERMSLRLILTGTQSQFARFDLESKSYGCVTFSRDGKSVLVGCQDGTALVYDVAAAVNGINKDSMP